MMVEGGDDVVGVERLAIVERDALAELEPPSLCILGGLDGLGELGNGLTVGSDLNQVVVDRAPEADIDDGRRTPGRGVVGIIGVRMRQAKPEATAFLGRR